MRKSFKRVYDLTTITFCGTSRITMWSSFVVLRFCSRIISLGRNNNTQLASVISLPTGKLITFRSTRTTEGSIVQLLLEESRQKTEQQFSFGIATSQALDTYINYILLSENNLLYCCWSSFGKQTLFGFYDMTSKEVFLSTKNGYKSGQQLKSSIAGWGRILV